MLERKETRERKPKKIVKLKKLATEGSEVTNERQKDVLALLNEGKLNRDVAFDALHAYLLQKFRIALT